MNQTTVVADNSAGIVWALATVVGVVIISAMFAAPPLVITLLAIIAAIIAGLLQIHRTRQRRRQTQYAFQQADSRNRDLLSRLNVIENEAQQNEAALSQMLDGLIMLSPDNQILLINESSRRLLALSLDSQLVGRMFAEVVRVPEITQAVQLARQGESNRISTVEIVDGATIRPVRVLVNRITQSDNSRLLLMLRDETEARRVEEMRREFIANISHELKTPLAAIKGYAETVQLAVKDDPDAASHFMNQIQTQCLRLERLVSDMMQLARAQSGGEFMTMTRVKLEDIIAEALKSYRPVANAKSILLTVAESPGGAFVHSDREATLTIANNLIGNAIRYTPAGGHVTVSCRRSGESNDRWALVVADDGVGIPLSDQDRIFERFYRVDKTRESADGGTGIGLSIVKNLTIALGGQVAVSSSPNRGATFEVVLQAADPVRGSSENSQREGGLKSVTSS